MSDQTQKPPTLNPDKIRSRSDTYKTHEQAYRAFYKWIGKRGWHGRLLQDCMGNWYRDLWTPYGLYRAGYPAFHPRGKYDNSPRHRWDEEIRPHLAAAQAQDFISRRYRQEQEIIRKEVELVARDARIAAEREQRKHAARFCSGTVLKIEDVPPGVIELQKLITATKSLLSQCRKPTNENNERNTGNAIRTDRPIKGRQHHPAKGECVSERSGQVPNLNSARIRIRQVERQNAITRNAGRSVNAAMRAAIRGRSIRPFVGVEV